MQGCSSPTCVQAAASPWQCLMQAARCKQVLGNRQLLLHGAAYSMLAGVSFSVPGVQVTAMCMHAGVFGEVRARPAPVTTIVTMIVIVHAFRGLGRGWWDGAVMLPGLRA